jgi:hypothetical protein
VGRRGGGGGAWCDAALCGPLNSQAVGTPHGWCCEVGSGVCVRCMIRAGLPFFFITLTRSVLVVVALCLAHAQQTNTNLERTAAA